MPPARERAVVLGAGVAGLLAAAALASAGLDVVVVDRAALPTEAGSEGGHSGQQPVVVGAGGGRDLEELLPGVTTELLSGGAVVGRAVVVRDRLRLVADGALTTTRSGLETSLRRRVGLLPGVALWERTSVIDVGLAGTRVPYDVVVSSPDHLADLRILHGDLVVDASGRATRLPIWLCHNGFGSVPEERRRLDGVWTTHHFVGDLPVADGGGDAVAVTVTRTREVARAGRMVTQGVGRCAVTLVGYDDERPPCRQADLAAYAERLAAPDIAEALRTFTPAGPTDEGVVSRVSATVRRRYDRTALPERLAVVGEARRSLDPLVGDGVARAAREALALRSTVAVGLAGLTQRYLSAVSTT